MSRETSPAAAQRRRTRSARQQASWAQRSGEVATRPLLAREEHPCGACLLPVRVGDQIARFTDLMGSWWGHALCVAAARAERPP